MKLHELKNCALKLDRATEISPLWAGEQFALTKVPGHKAIYNTDLKKFAAVVSKGYNLVQHQVVVDSVVTALQNLNIQADCRVRDGRNKIFVDLNFFDKSKLQFKEVGEEFEIGLRVINSYDKSTGIVIAPRLLRLACKNGMVVDRIVTGFNIRHTKKLVEDFETVVQKLLNKIINSSQKLRELVSDCIHDSVEWELLDKFLNSEVAAKHAENIKALLPEKPTRWDVYNAFTNYATHGAQIKPTVEQLLQTKAQKILVKPIQVKSA